MKYRVIKFFNDLQDNCHHYNVGDPYPREGLEVSEKRINQLIGSANRQKTPLIETVADKKVARQETILSEEVQTEVMPETPRRGRKKKEQ